MDNVVSLSDIIITQRYLIGDYYMVFQGVRGPVELTFERMGNGVQVFPTKRGTKVLLVDACNAVLDYLRAGGAQSVTVRMPDGPTLNIQSSHSRDLFTQDREYREAPLGATYEVSSASMGGR